MKLKENRIEKTVRFVVKFLVDREYEELAKITNNLELLADQIRESVDGYPGVLVMPPENAYDDIDVIEITGPPPTRWSVNYDLWTQEGLSDLTLEMTLIDCDNEYLKIELDGIHVL